ncbi:CobW family GTP-binding protein [Thauera chlorobenzoica]|uniref:GTPase n=1 Tax=Thauera chlorobenzoica TaxID=96773 RepID=A0A1H5T1Y8_9RHOO|nr:GTP-binding protein [Thauera chlorobenzoica]APR04144.1 GTPase [Thauera chlorobenzoica]SEF56902.1 GTPase, G3E family [Thauera chlorobenzoica]
MNDNAPRPDDRRIPVTVLTGFLGAGKTTLLNHLVRQPRMEGCAVLINEFGEVAVDHHLVEKVDETLIVLDSGCLCCSVRGDLVRALKGLFMRALRRELKSLRRVLIETTGLADPAPLIHTLMAEPFLAERYRIDGVVAAVDVTHALAQLAVHNEAVRQVAMADRLLLTKCDLADAAARAAVAARLALLNPGARQVDVRGGAVAAAELFDCGLYDAAGKAPDVTAWLGEAAVHGALPVPGGEAVSRHGGGVHSFVLRFDAPLPWYEFSDALALLLQLHGGRILRIKGLLDVAGDPLPRVLQCVQHSVYPAASLPAWPSQPPYDERCSRLVFIVRDLARDEVAAMLAAFIGQQPATPG